MQVLLFLHGQVRANCSRDLVAVVKSVSSCRGCKEVV